MPERDNVTRFIEQLDLNSDSKIYRMSSRITARLGERHDGKEPIIYSLDTLNELKSTLRSTADMGDRSIRYLVTPENTLLFAQCGSPKGNVAAHEEISRFCLSAGQLVFDETLTFFTAINHESGYFKPPMESLIWPLKILCQSALLNDDGLLNVTYMNDIDSTECFLQPLSVQELKEKLATLTPTIKSYPQQPTDGASSPLPTWMTSDATESSSQAQSGATARAFSNTESSSRPLFFSPLKKPRPQTAESSPSMRL